jgi:hypothetical protein
MSKTIAYLRPQDLRANESEPCKCHSKKNRKEKELNSKTVDIKLKSNASVKIGITNEK